MTLALYVALRQPQMELSMSVRHIYRSTFSVGTKVGNPLQNLELYYISFNTTKPFTLQ